MLYKLSYLSTLMKVQFVVLNTDTEDLCCCSWQVHKMLEKIDTYLWSQRPKHLVPQVTSNA